MSTAVPAHNWRERRTRQRGLYPRQQEALQLLAQGFKYQEIAAQLGIRVGTVSSYVGGAVQALGAANPQEAITLAREAGFIE